MGRSLRTATNPQAPQTKPLPSVSPGRKHEYWSPIKTGVTIQSGWVGLWEKHAALGFQVARSVNTKGSHFRGVLEQAGFSADKR